MELGKAAGVDEDEASTVMKQAMAMRKAGGATTLADTDAAADGELGEVERLVGEGLAHPNTEWKHPFFGGFLALCRASYYGRTEVALRLVALNADVNRAQSAGTGKDTPLHAAARQGKGETVEALIRRYAYLTWLDGT